MICILLAIGGVFAAVCVACTRPTSPPPSLVGPATSSRLIVEPCNAPNFVRGVRLLRQGYDPENFADPQTDRSLSDRDPIAQDLKNAFEIAPNDFKTALCSLDGVFIDQNSCDPDQGICYEHSWAFCNPEMDCVISIFPRVYGRRDMHRTLAEDETAQFNDLAMLLQHNKELQHVARYEG